jgi:glutathione S-transferase
MALKLYFHPLASFCHKALIALYENRIPFESIIVDLGDEASGAAFRAVWPMAKMPVLRDEARNRTVAESTIIIEFLDAHYPGPTRFLPTDVDRAWQTRMWDRFYDHYVQEPMQKIVGDRLRPEGNADAYGVELAKAQLQKAYGVMEPEMESKPWAIGADFTLADCAAAPALFYANTVVPFAETHKNLGAYLDRLMTRPSFARVLEEAQPYFNLFPLERKPTITRLGRVASH